MCQRLTDQISDKEDVCQPQSRHVMHMKKIVGEDMSEVVVMKQQQQTHALHERTVHALAVRTTLVKEPNRSSQSLCQRGCNIAKGHVPTFHMKCPAESTKHAVMSQCKRDISPHARQ